MGINVKLLNEMCNNTMHLDKQALSEMINVRRSKYAHIQHLWAKGRTQKAIDADQLEKSEKLFLLTSWSLIDEPSLREKPMQRQRTMNMKVRGMISGIRFWADGITIRELQQIPVSVFHRSLTFLWYKKEGTTSSADINRRPEQQRPINSPREAGEINSRTFEATTTSLDPEECLYITILSSNNIKTRNYIRSAVRTWLRLPKDCLMHTYILKSPIVAWEFPLRYQTPLLRVGKLKRLKSTPLICGEAAVGILIKEIKECEERLKEDGKLLDKEGAREVWTNKLTNSCDAKALDLSTQERFLEYIKSARTNIKKLVSDIINDIKNTHKLAGPLLSHETSQSDLVIERAEERTKKL
ncbi:hypothetical protein GWI33_011505 [Rhynchophorus ferrugineus]|uniref:Uncharacterized protein n=1 Tax=Rhynchophorus ferrugineus TaxID=354439 RepID=A0A834M8C4_RHYFE|nr:hypothetical protein GWI33_011505 [Rhynchophorus ferrugineus]